MPRRLLDKQSLKMPKLSAFDAQLKGSGERKISTTMAFVRILATLVRDKNIGSRIVPIVPDEARTFGMEGMFRQLGIYSSVGQLYQPEDADALAAYRESKDGQVIEAGINEAGAFAAWMAAGTSYSNHLHTLIPFYISTQCLVFSALVIWPGRLVICKPEAFCWAVLRGAPP